MGTRGWHGLGRLAGRRPRAAPARVLVVDDDEVIRQLIMVHLRVGGFEVAPAFDGQDALSKVGEFRPDVITLDAVMPGLDGWATAARLRSDPATASIRVVVLSPQTADGDPAADGTAGVDARVAKPFDPEELIAVVHRLARAANRESLAQPGTSQA
jgi:CheY-like chemotaxis protein